MKDLLTMPVLLTRDLELCLVGGRNWRTLVGVSFSMECLRWATCLRSGCGVEEMGRNMGGAGKNTQRAHHNHATPGDSVVSNTNKPLNWFGMVKPIADIVY